MNGQSIKILLVEDNAGDARLVHLMLSEGSTGSTPTLTFNLTHVEQLNQAQKVLNQETFDIILLDLSLPDGYGLDTVSRVRHLAPDVPIVVMSGLSDEVLAVKAVQEGAQDYLVKGHVDSYGLIRALRYAIERKRIEIAEREQREFAEALRDIIAALNSTLNLEEVLERILTNVDRVVPHDTANIMLIKAGIAQVVGGRGYSEPERPSMIGKRFVIADMPSLAWMAETGQLLIIPDTTNDPTWTDLPETRWIHSYAATPIRARAEIVGFINLASETPGFFTDTHARRLQAFAEQTGVAISNASLLEAEREQRLLAETLTGVSLALTSRVSLAEVLDEILHQVQRLVPHKAANIMLLEEDTLRIARWQGYHPAGNQEYFPHLVQSLRMLQIDAEVVESKKPVVITDTSQDPRWVVFEPTAWVKAHLSVPICLRDRVLGMLRLDGDTIGEFSVEDAQRLQPLANAAAIALENAQLFEQTQLSLAQTEALYQFTRSLIAFENLPDLLQAVAENVSKILPAEQAALVICDPKAKQIIHYVRAGGIKKQAVQVDFEELWQGLAGWVIREMKPALSPKGEPDTRESPAAQQRRLDLNYGAMLAVPLSYRAITLGAIIAINRPNQRDFTSQDMNLLIAITNQAAVAIENVQLFEATRQHVAELEALRQAGLSLTSSLELQIVLEAILESANLLTSLQNAQIYLYEDECLTFGAALRLDSHDSLLTEPLPNSLTYAVARQGEAINISNLHDHPLYSDPRQQGALLGLPLKIGARVVGVMIIQYHQPHHWPEAELRVLNLLADQAAIAIENASLYTQAQQEITERKRVEAKLNEYREHLEELVWERTRELEQAMREASDARDKTNAILQSAADGLIVTDTNYQIIMANPAAEALLGVEVEDMLGREVGAGIKDDRLREMVRYAFEQRASGHEVDIETDDPPNARKKVLRARTALVDDRQGQPLGTVTIIQDVTRLREIDRLKTELLTTTAHELRTPLTSILGFSEILLTREMNPERQKHYLSMINEQSSRLAKIVAELVDISRIESGQTLDLKLEQVDLAALMENVVILCAEKAIKHHPRLEGLADLPIIWGDPFRLSQVGQNLLLNAINYSPPGSTIIIQGQLESDFIQISVQDQGIGMTPEQQKHLFKPFYRAHASSTAIGGTGLGLATSKLIVEQHGGKIWLDSEVNVGTTVYFTLPLTRKQCEPAVQPDPS